MATHSRALCYDHLGEYEKALADANKAIELKPEDERVYGIRGAAYDGLGYTAEAATDYQKAIPNGR